MRTSTNAGNAAAAVNDFKSAAHSAVESLGQTHKYSDPRINLLRAEVHAFEEHLWAALGEVAIRVDAMERK